LPWRVRPLLMVQGDKDKTRSRWVGEHHHPQPLRDLPQQDILILFR
jgi:hypothetical protein